MSETSQNELDLLEKAVDVIIESERSKYPERDGIKVRVGNDF